MDIPDTVAEAKRIQRVLQKKVTIVPLKREPAFIAGVDAAFSGDRVIGAACLYTFPGLVPVEDGHAITKVMFPYIPGLLSFREGPAIIQAIGRLRKKPDVLLFDGQGIAHPAGMGIASHIGVLLNIPAIGCAKSRLVGDYSEPGRRKGRSTLLRYQNKIIGTVLRSRDNVKPLFVSPGHLIDMKDTMKLVLTCIHKYRIPEPIRRADALTRKIKKEMLCQGCILLP